MKNVVFIPYGVQNGKSIVYLYPIGYNAMIEEFVKNRRQQAGLTQPELAQKAGVGLRFIRELEQGKETMRLDKVNQVLKLFGYELGPVEMKREILLNTPSAERRLKGSDAVLGKKNGKNEKS